MSLTSRGSACPGGTSKGAVPGGTAIVGEGTAYTDVEVDKPVSMRPGDISPHYPDPLRTANVEGEVLVSFVVDTMGRPEMSTFKVVHATHALFVEAVKSALITYRYYPAEIGGHKVRQLVQQPFNFTLSGR